jgi:uracil-DNA glycosylase
MTDTSPTGWRAVLAEETEKPYYRQLQEFVKEERSKYTVYPPPGDVFNALRLTPIHEVKVLLLGQDPYHGPGQAHGLCFSVRPGVPVPPSLQNMYKELHDDVGFKIPKHGYLVHWAEQGVLLLNAVLTVRAGQANSHKGHGWETFTDAVIRAVNAKPERVVFLLWGAYARQKRALIDTRRHLVLEAAHPSPLSASNGFFGCRHFSKTNAALEAAGRGAIDWQLPETVA